MPLILACMVAGGIISRMLRWLRKEADLTRHHVGIDVGKRTHHACVHDTVEDRYSKVVSFTVDRQGFDRFLLFLRRQGPADEVLVGVEASGPYALTIAYFLQKKGYAVVELNPFRASQFRKAQGKKAKKTICVSRLFMKSPIYCCVNV